MDSNLITGVKSPIGLFVIAILVCNAVFAVCAAKLKNPTSFKYCIHMFLGVLLFFGSILVWSPASLYPPAEIKDIDFPRNPWVPTVVTFLGVFLYMLYQGWSRWLESRKKPQKQNSETNSVKDK